MTADTTGKNWERVELEWENFLTCDVVNMVFLLQKWEAIEFDHLICDAIGAQEVSNSFCDQKYYLGGMASDNRTASEPRQSSP